MGKGIKSLMEAAEAAGYAMAPDDIYAPDDFIEARIQHQVMTPVAPNALVPLQTATPRVSLTTTARNLVSRYSSSAWLMMPRMPA